jgi:hypothetical protein
MEVDYPFLFIDLHKKKEHSSMFRRRFDEFILTEDLNGNAKLIYCK